MLHTLLYMHYLSQFFFFLGGGIKEAMKIKSVSSGSDLSGRFLGKPDFILKDLFPTLAVSFYFLLKYNVQFHQL